MHVFEEGSAWFFQNVRKILHHKIMYCLPVFTLDILHINKFTSESSSFQFYSALCML